MENISIIKTIFKIDFSVYILAIVAIFTAAFKEFLIIIYLIMIHEIGHSLIAYLFGIKVKEIKIYPLGGISKFEMPLNINRYKELLILIAGPLFQELAYIIALVLLPDQYSIFKVYNYNILVFNLLPIYPLDGGKLLKIIFDGFIPYKKSLIIVIIISYIAIFISLIGIKVFNINVLITIVFLMYLVLKEEKKVNYVYNKFLLERYLSNYSFPQVKIINNINSFYRNKKHLIKINNNYYYEKDILQQKYQKTNKKY